jgi:hypothetical protein
MPPMMMNAATADGAPPRRNKRLKKKTHVHLIAPPCLGEALRRVTS